MTIKKAHNVSFLCFAVFSELSIEITSNIHALAILIFFKIQLVSRLYDLFFNQKKTHHMMSLGNLGGQTVIRPVYKNYTLVSI